MVRKVLKIVGLVVASLVVVVAIGLVAMRKEAKGFYYGLQAYVYGFPLVIMDVTKDVFTATRTAGTMKAPINQFAVMKQFPDASFRAISRTGLDTLFATAWVDLAQGPVVLSVPDTKGRYYVIALFDMWSNVFASIGKRTTGTGAASFLIVGPGWTGTPPSDVRATFRSPTRFVWVNGQMQTDGPKDFAVVDALQSQYALTPLNAWGRPYRPPAEVPPAGGVDGSTPAVEQIHKMDAGTYFDRLARLMKDNPPSAADAPMLAKLRKIGVEPGEPFDLGKLDPGVGKGVRHAMWGYELLEKGVKKLKTENGWIVMPKDMGSYGTDYQTRAGIAFVGLGAIQPQDATYPTAFQDGDGHPFDGAHDYVLHLEKGQTPPTNATWSVSMYDPDGYYVPNNINRFSLNAWMPLAYNPDGSLDLYIQAESPGEARATNWLPAPQTGAFNLTVRNYWPKQTMLDG